MEFWKTILNLENWQTTLEWGTRKLLGNNIGLNIFSPEEEISNIYLDRRLKDNGAEETLVHELLHLVYDGHKAPEGQPYSTLHERAINRTARAMMSLRYAHGSTDESV